MGEAQAVGQQWEPSSAVETAGDQGAARKPEQTPKAEGPEEGPI
mgnify:CR=1 FL=1